MGSRSVEAAGSVAEVPDEDRHEQAIEQGIEIGLARALKSAGLDANIYELNSAPGTGAAVAQRRRTLGQW